MCAWPQSGTGPHGKLGRKSLGVSAGRSLCGASWSGGRNRTAIGRKPLAALPRPLSAPAGLPRTGANIRKSFRPTASRTRGTEGQTQNQKQTQIPCACRAPLEKTMEADISTLRKTGHFYFGDTRQESPRPVWSSGGCAQRTIAGWGTLLAEMGRTLRGPGINAAAPLQEPGLAGALRVQGGGNGCGTEGGLNVL